MKNAAAKPDPSRNHSSAGVVRFGRPTRIRVTHGSSSSGGSFTTFPDGHDRTLPWSRNSANLHVWGVCAPIGQPPSQAAYWPGNLTDRFQAANRFQSDLRLEFSVKPTPCPRHRCLLWRPRYPQSAAQLQTRQIRLNQWSENRGPLHYSCLSQRNRICGVGLRLSP